MSVKTMEGENPKVFLIEVAKVTIDREVRQRTNVVGGLEHLADDIELNGQLHPITLRDGDVLVAGERRLEAFRLRGWKKIRAQRMSLTFTEAYRVELAENLKRRTLPWQDEVRAIGTFHAMKVQEIGPMWTVLATANELTKSETNVRRYLAVFEFNSDQEVMGAQSLDGAFNLIKGRAERARAAAGNRGLDIAASLPLISSTASPEARGAALSTLIGKRSLDDDNGLQGTAPGVDDADFRLVEAGRLAEASLRAAAEAESTSADDSIITASFLDWIETYEGQPFDFLHLDFPYGKGYTGSNTRRTGRAHIAPTYADDPDVFWELLEAFLTWQDKVAYPVAHLMFWFDMEHYTGVRDTLGNAGWRLVQPHPLIWHKPYQGVAADTKRRPRHTYETAFLCSRGDRKIVKLEQDVFVGRVDEKLHINQKSQEMLRHFLTMTVDEHTAVFDPTCGSGSALAAARQLGAHRVLGVEMDEENAKVARFLLKRDGDMA